MKHVTLYKTDFANDGGTMNWDSFLEALGIETSDVVEGTIINKKIEAVTIQVAHSEIERNA